MINAVREYKSFFSSQSPSIASNGRGIVYLEIKRLDRQSEHAVPPNRLFKVQNVWRCISTSNLIPVVIWHSNWLLSKLVYSFSSWCIQVSETVKIRRKIRFRFCYFTKNEEGIYKAILGTFSYSRKEPLSYVMSVRLFVRTYQSRSH